MLGDRSFHSLGPPRSLYLSLLAASRWGSIKAAGAPILNDPLREVPRRKMRVYEEFIMNHRATTPQSDVRQSCRVWSNIEDSTCIRNRYVCIHHRPIVAVWLPDAARKTALPAANVFVEDAANPTVYEEKSNRSSRRSIWRHNCGLAWSLWSQKYMTHFYIRYIHVITNIWKKREKSIKLEKYYKIRLYIQKIRIYIQKILRNIFFFLALSQVIKNFSII